MGQGWRAPGTSFQETYPSESQRTHSVPPATNCQNQGCRAGVFIEDWSCGHPLMSRSSGPRKETRCSRYTTLSSLGAVNQFYQVKKVETLLKSVFPDKAKDRPSRHTFPRRAVQACCVTLFCTSSYIHVLFLNGVPFPYCTNNICTLLE